MGCWPQGRTFKLRHGFLAVNDRYDGVAVFHLLVIPPSSQSTQVEYVWDVCDEYSICDGSVKQSDITAAAWVNNHVELTE